MQVEKIALFYDREKNKYVKGKIIYYDDWYEKWKLGGNYNDGKVFDIIFEDGECPNDLTKEDFPIEYERMEKKFKDLMGISYEDFCVRGKPSYYELSKQKLDDLKKKLQKGKDMRKKRILESREGCFA